MVAVSITDGRPGLPFTTTTMGTSASKMQLQQQDLLILLHHARKCPHGECDDDVCPVSPNCAATKRLWQHIAHCKHKKCPHCYSARKLLTHYRDCKDGNCMVCGPVREEVQRSREEKRLEQQQHQMQGISKTDTFSTSMTTAPSAGRSKTTIDEWVSLRRMTIDGGAGNNIRQTPTSALESSPARPPIIPVRRGRSFGSMSSLSHCSSILSSTRSSVPSSRSGGSRRSSGVYCSECRRLGGVQATRVCSSGIRCRTNLGIAHFCKPIGEGGSQK